MQNLKIVEKGEARIENKKYLVIKRALDIVLSIISIVVLLPLMLIVALIIAIDSRGEIVFSHKRIGKNGSTIKVYKFRTMHINSAEMFENFTEEQKNEYNKNFKLQDDPRITRVGEFLRKSSLDELPQLWNILRGDMSIVGPRPIVEKEVCRYGKFAGKLFCVKPGLTGYWQVNGRSDTSYERRVEMDLFYINNMSFWLDFKIIFRTVYTVIRREGAI